MRWQSYPGISTWYEEVFFLLVCVLGEIWLSRNGNSSKIRLVYKGACSIATRIVKKTFDYCNVWQLLITEGNVAFPRTTLCLSAYDTEISLCPQG